MGSVKQAIQAEKSKGLTLRFEIRTEKSDKEGKAPIRLVLQVSGQRKYKNTGVSILPQCWDPKKQEAYYVGDKKTVAKLYPPDKFPPPPPNHLFLASSEAQQVNETLLQEVRAVKNVTDRFLLDRVVYSAQMVVDKLNENTISKTKKTEVSNVLFEFIDKYLEDNRSSREPGSLTVYRSMKNHLQAYQEKTKKRVTFDSVDYAFFQSFQNFLISRTKFVAGVEVPMLNNTTIAKQLSTVKTFLSYAKIQGIKVPDGYKSFKISKEKLEVIALTSDEFEKLFYLDLVNNKKLAQVRDIFCFSCVTGFRYSDLKQLKREHIKAEEIRLSVIKTGEMLTVPLSPYSKAILARYEAQRKPLPMISNQKLNDYIKDLCQFAGIDEPIEIVRFRGVKREAITYPKYELIGVHNGRKTFATLSLEKGMSTQQVMAIGGWRDYKSFERYVNVTEKLKIVSTNKAWGDELRTTKLKAI